MIPTVIIVTATLLFFAAERLLPGRELPEAPGWYARAAFLNLCQLLIILMAGLAWNHWLQRWSHFPHLGFDACRSTRLARMVCRDVCILLVAPCAS